jgi:hypothetical protein
MKPGRTTTKPAAAPRPAEGRSLYVLAVDVQGGAKAVWWGQPDVDAWALKRRTSIEPGATGTVELAKPDRYPLSWYVERMRSVCGGCGLRKLVEGKCAACGKVKEVEKCRAQSGTSGISR